MIQNTFEKEKHIMGKERKTTFWNVWDNIQGDKVIWMVVIILMLFSIVSIFSSTTLMATQKYTRMDIFWEQMQVVILGSVIITICYFIPKIGFFRYFSKFGFLVSLIFLGLLFTPWGARVNGAVRGFRLGGMVIQSYEIVKVAMVMYLSWAIYTYKKDNFTLANILSKKFKSMEFLSRPGWKRIMYIHIPILTVCALTLPGSFSSTAFVGGIMFATILIGGIEFKDLVYVGILFVVSFAMLFGTYKFIDGALDRKTVMEIPIMNRFPTIEGRIQRFFTSEEENEGRKLTAEERRKILDARLQPEGAKIAIHEGGILGKGAGKSTQKYAVPLIFSDFMYSFIIEEFGLIAGIILIVLYVSLLARGSIIVRSCDNEFAKTAVAGLTLLISGQALMHMYINAGLWPLTGQTLPMISHGKTSFIAFSIAFGILLSISKMAKKKVEQEAEMAGPLVVQSDDEIQAGLNDLDILESMHLDEEQY